MRCAPQEDAGQLANEPLYRPKDVWTPQPPHNETEELEALSLRLTTDSVRDLPIAPRTASERAAPQSRYPPNDDRDSAVADGTKRPAPAKLLR